MIKASVASTFFDRLDTLISRNPPYSTSRWRPVITRSDVFHSLGRKPQRETFHRATRFFREALFPLLPPQAKRFQDSRRPKSSSQYIAPEDGTT